MKLPPLAYARPETLARALDLLSDETRETRVLAGGQSLLAAMNFRLSSPDLLVDINRIPGLAGISEADGVVRIGAMTRHASVAASEVVASRLPLLARAVAHVAHPAVRNRGTIGGSLSLADPAAEMPAVALAADATLVARSRRGERRIAAGDFFLGLYETALETDELLVAVDFPAPCAVPERWAFAEQARRHGDYATAGVAIQVRNGRFRIALFGVSDRPVRAASAEQVLTGRSLDAATIAEAAARATDGVSVHGDHHTSEAMKRHLCTILTRRALASLPDGDAP